MFEIVQRKNDRGQLNMATGRMSIPGQKAISVWAAATLEGKSR
jgi:hypothetical protein